MPLPTPSPHITHPLGTPDLAITLSLLHVPVHTSVRRAATACPHREPSSLLEPCCTALPCLHVCPAARPLRVPASVVLNCTHPRHVSPACSHCVTHPCLHVCPAARSLRVPASVVLNCTHSRHVSPACSHCVTHQRALVSPSTRASLHSLHTSVQRIAPACPHREPSSLLEPCCTALPCLHVCPAARPLRVPAS